MSPVLNHTHDPAARSWLASAQQPGTDFPIQNLPLAVFRRRGSPEPFRGGVAIGDQIIDLAFLTRAAVLQGLAAQAAQAAAQPRLNALMALGPAAWTALRHGLFALLQTSEKKAADTLSFCRSLTDYSGEPLLLQVRVG